MDLGATYEVLLGVNAGAFAAGHYEVAYHALEGALHCANGLKDQRRVGEVARLAAEQGNWIDAHTPGHRVSSASAAKRGTQPVFRSCAQTAAAMLALLHAQQSQRQPP
jgi:hypothetical protein